MPSGDPQALGVALATAQARLRELVRQVVAEATLVPPQPAGLQASLVEAFDAVDVVIGHFDALQTWLDTHLHA
jgi:hypothetical protein